MKITNNLPVPFDETFNIQDATKIKTYMLCERLYFFNYVLGFRPDSPIHNLSFGKAWHDGMEDLLKNKNPEQAYNSFLSTYREDFTEATDLSYGGKSPMHALLSYQNFLREFSDLLERMELLGTETGVAIHIGQDRILYGKMDSIFNDPLRGILSLEHKTTGARFGWWEEHWQLDFQVSTYHLILMAHFIGQKIYGVIINGCIFYKDRVEFWQVPVSKSLESLEDFIFEANRHFENLERDFESLSHCTPQHETLKAFPRRVKNCVQYNRICPMFDVCNGWHNPLRYLDQVPGGYKVEYWNPTKDYENNKLEIKL